MKIYEPKPLELVRLQIVRAGDETQWLTLCEATKEEVKAMCEQLIIAQNISPFIKGKRTTINIREAVGGKNGKAISVSFFGISPKETIALIINQVSKSK